MAIQTRSSEAPVVTRLVSLMTADEFALVPETNKICELINGEVVMAPAPLAKHQWATFRLARLLDDLVMAAGIGSVFLAPFDVELGPYQVYQPDISVIARSKAGNMSKNGYRGGPELVVEVLSPSNRRQDLVVKAAEYAAAGITEYWVVDPENDRIEVNRLEHGAYVVATSTDDIARSIVLPGFEVAPAAIFTMPEWMTSAGASGTSEEV